MVSWMAANSDPGLVREAPSCTRSRAAATSTDRRRCSRRSTRTRCSPRHRTLLGIGGSTIVFGDFLVIPINDSFLYVQPVYVRSNAGELDPRAEARHRRERETRSAWGRACPRRSPPRRPGSPAVATAAAGAAGRAPSTSRSRQLLDQALQHFAAAEAALTAGDLGTYQSELSDGAGLVQQANDLAAEQAGPVVTGSPSPPSPSAEPVALAAVRSVGSRNPRSASTSATSICAFCRRPE